MTQLKAKKKKLNKVKHVSISRLNISSLVCMVRALQSYPVMISLFVEKSIVLYNCTIVLSGIFIRHSVDKKELLLP